MLRVKNEMPHYLKYYDLARLATKQMNNVIKPNFVLVSLDIDNFNYINDLFGYAVGDQVLDHYTRFVSDSMNDGEYFCHLHADQYVLWIPETKKDKVFKRLSLFTNAKEAMVDVLPIHYNMVFSVGVVKADSLEQEFSSLVDKANFARKQAKGNYRNTYMYYDESMAKNMEWRKNLTLMMEKALKKNEFVMYLQPKVIIKTGEIAGAEALARWNSSVLGMIQPDRFIPIMERNGFIRQLDFFILKQVCNYLKERKENNDKVMPISVNFSKAHLRDDDFIKHLSKIVKLYDINPSLIEIEFTENMFAEDFELLIEAANSLKVLGFKVALDDFGSAYSSLNCLKDIPLDVIKIDKSFFGLTANTDKGRIIIAKMIELIKSLKMTPVMEGIEEMDQVEFLKKLNCDMGQGYFYAKPMPADDYTQFVKTSDLLKKNSPKAKRKTVFFH